MNNTLRHAWADIDLDVIAENVRVLARTFAPAELCAVVKADGYGHGALPSAKAAVSGGATRLAVALVEEGRVLREGGITQPVLLLSQPPLTSMDEVVAYDITPTLYTTEAIDALAEAVERAGRRFAVHLKVDTGMHRVGFDPTDAVDLVENLLAHPALVWEGLYTHFANADEPEDGFTEKQSDVFEHVLTALAERFELPPLLHTSNTAGGLAFAEERRSMVRCGIGIYGVAPSDEVGLPPGVRPAMSVRTEVTYAKRLQAGDGVSYGQRYVLDRPANVATIPLGYADGVYRVLSSRGAEVLIGGERHRMAGNVTMDQTVIDCGEASIGVGDEVVLIGTQGDETITANEWGRLADTIGYEIVCRIGPRLPRRYLGGT